MIKLPKVDRVYRRIQEWEEIAHNMWGSPIPSEKEALEWALRFTGNHKVYGSFMVRVINEWPASCENALTDNFLNRRAWIGHAAAALANKCPEHVTRKAWGFLSDEQRILANMEAERAILLWFEHRRKSGALRSDLDKQMLF